MNVLHLKYAVEVAKTKSISKAAENLFMGQPNLSRAIKELETKLGINIFERTRGGIVVTPEGERFLRYAERIVEQLDELEDMYEGEAKAYDLSVCAVEGICVDNIVEEWLVCNNDMRPLIYKLGYNEAVINAVLGRDASIGIIKYDEAEAGVNKIKLTERKLMYRSVGIYEYGLCADMAERIPVMAEKMCLEVIVIWREGYSFTEQDLKFIELMNPLE